MYCWKCGKEISDQAAFCSSCGAEVKQGEKVPQTPAEKRQIDRGAFIAIGAIVLLLALAVTVVLGMVSRIPSPKVTADPAPTAAITVPPETTAPTPAPAPAEEPEPTETPRPRFISPEQYALENGLDWPAEDSDAWSYRKNPYSEGFAAWSTCANVARSWDESSYQNSDSDKEEYVYANKYVEARAEGKSDTEAHEIAMNEARIDRRILGKEEYTEFLYRSSLEAGVSEYVAEELREQDSITWDIAWYAYKYARDTGSNHEKASGSVDWKCFENVADSNQTNRYAAYLDQGMSAQTAKDNAKEETAKIYELLQYWYEIDEENIPS